MDYILTNLDDYNTANEEYNIKLDLWRKEIESRKLSIKVANEELEIKKPLIPDEIYQNLKDEIDFDENNLIINKNKITFSQEPDINNINWKKHDIDYVFECTGKFNSKDKLEPHLKNGAKRVIVSAPCKNADKTIVFGVN